MSGAGRRGDSQSCETALPSGGSNYNSVARKVKAAGVVWGETELAETVTLDTSVKEMLSHLPESKQDLGDALISKLKACLEQSYKDEPAFSANLMETLGILGDAATATEVSLTETLLIRAEVTVTDILGKELENVGIDIARNSRVDICLIERVGNLNLVLSCFELKAGSRGPRLLRDGETPTFAELGGNECGPLSQQLSYSIKMTVPILRAFKGYGDAITSAVISCKSTGNTTKLDSVRATRFRIKPPKDYDGGWTVRAIESIEGNGQNDSAAAASMLVSTLTEGLRRSASPTLGSTNQFQGGEVGPLPLLGPLLPGTRLVLSPFVRPEGRRITQGELLEIVDEAKFGAFLSQVEDSVFDAHVDAVVGDVVKISRQDSVIPWANTASELSDVLGKAAAIPEVRARLEEVIKVAGPFGDGGFFAVMPNLEHSTKAVTRDLLKTKWGLFFDQIVKQMLLPMLDKGVVYYDLRSATTNVRWLPLDRELPGQFLLWDLDSLRPSRALRSQLPEDGRLPQLDPERYHARNFVFAQVLIVAFCADRNVGEDVLMTLVSKKQQGGYLWSRIQPNIPLVTDFNAWIGEQERRGCLNLQEAVQKIRNGEQVDRACLDNLSQLKLS